MIEVLFNKVNGETDSFDAIEKVSVGSTISDVKEISKDELLTKVLPLGCVYHLTGKNKNVTYLANNVVSVTIDEY